ncbi:Peptidase family M1 [Marivirga sericea]|uniref:Peptidase family M1 n=1 Tax=Marivirga sericea TaxID=1028 RepID=A0A1X7L508_9BACT|nr:M1 family metallopeptidase [Marivirga sericea]SMG48815.1 Peptidase family M1 [Marivirga sericea]
MRIKTYTFIVIISIICLMLHSCYYKPFVGYTLNKKGFKNFSKKERMAGDNSNPARDYKINRYDWVVEVFPEQQRISGTMDIHLNTLSSQKVLLFDLQKKMRISSYHCSVEDAHINRKGDFLYLKFDKPVPKNTSLKLKISYEGKPANVASQGPVQWKKDKQDRFWISTVTEGIGPHFIMPCNALLNAEADSSSITVTVPDQLVAVANGRLTGVKNHKGNKTKTYRYQILNPINTYSLSFNLGHFVKLTKPYTDISGSERDLVFQVLDYNQDTASSFYDQTPIIFKELEKLYGGFPFWEDGSKFIESTFSAMEHQSGIAMGSNYRNNWKEFNTTLIHELAHEWWGNSVTGLDYCDIWMHEGMATYSEALVLERIYGPDAYDLRIKLAARRVKNTIPILKECGVLYNSWVNPADQDIYNKGALMMHSLRIVVDNDSLFFNTLADIQNDLAKQNVSTASLIAKFNNLLGNDYSSLFEYYLKEAKPPVLEVFIDKEEDKIYYRWQEEIPFYKDGEISIEQDDKEFHLIPTTAYKSIKLKNAIPISFQIEKSIYYTVKYQKEI